VKRLKKRCKSKMQKKDYYEKNLNPLPPAGYDSGKKGNNKVIKMLEGKMAEQDMMVLMWERETKREGVVEAEA
jgi:hypothetical protein